MKVYYDIDEIELSQETIDAAIKFGANYRLSMQKQEPDSACCWEYFSVLIDDMGQPRYLYGESVSDVEISIDSMEKRTTSIGVFLSLASDENCYKYVYNNASIL